MKLSIRRWRRLSPSCRRCWADEVKCKLSYSIYWIFTSILFFPFISQLQESLPTTSLWQPKKQFMSLPFAIVSLLMTRTVSTLQSLRLLDGNIISFLFAATGAGRSKKEAKHAAAKALIDKLTGLNLSDTFYEQQKQPGEISATSTNTNFDKKNQMENPIGLLQELCKSKNWPPPSYEMEVEVGLPHEREFTIGCLVLKHRKVGVGKTKKIAKRRAAQELWKRLQLQPLDQNQ